MQGLGAFVADILDVILLEPVGCWTQCRFACQNCYHHTKTISTLQNVSDERKVIEK